MAYRILVALVLSLSIGTSAFAQAPFTDDPIVPGVTVVRAIHVAELRSRINALRVANGLGNFVFTDPLFLNITFIRAVHIIELRSALAQVYTALGRSQPAYTDLVLATQATQIRAAHISELRAAVVAAEGEDFPVFSPAVITLENMFDDTFTSRTANVVFLIANETFSTNRDEITVLVNGTLIDNAKIATTGIFLPSGVLQDGLNELELLAHDSHGLQIDSSFRLWAGSATLTGRVVNESGVPLAGVLVRASVPTDDNVDPFVITSTTGDFAFSNVPARTVILTANAGGNRAATAMVRGNSGFVTLHATAIGPPSPIANNDFSLGTSGWNIGSAPVQLIPHVEPQSDGMVVVQAMDFDLQLATLGQGPQAISRTFNTIPGTKNVTIRYRFVTSEVPGGFFGSQYDDGYSVTIRSNGGGQVIRDVNSMNGLGLAAFDGGGATAWRETSVPVNPSGDLVEVGLTVTNVADGQYDSYVVVDVVSEKKLAITQVVLHDIDVPADSLFNRRLKFLSVDPSNPYFSGTTRIHGTITIEGAADDSLQSLNLDIIQNGLVRATASLDPSAEPLLLRSFGTAEKVQITTSQLLFRLSNAQAAGVDQSIDSTLTLQARARTTNGQHVIMDVGVVVLLARYTGTNRYGFASTDPPDDVRDNAKGGDDWAQPTLIGLVTRLSSMTTGTEWGDFSNMNGGTFPPHAEHKKGLDVDGRFPTYANRDGETFTTLASFLDDPIYGPKIKRILVTFTPTFAALVENAPPLQDGRLVKNIIRHAKQNHGGHFHLDLD
jgi:hypothetical protein